MNFFEHQDQAKRNTVWLVILFILAVGIIMAGAVGITLSATGSPGAALLASIGVILVVSVGIAFKSFQLRKGGKVIAEQLGGRLINVSTQNSEESRLLNIVEEMAIASGMVVPSVYVIDSDGINAFAAGFSTNDAVIGVTRGCIEQLNRAELQGVVAHEFSHIMHGDMKINLRLLCVLHGILVIGLTGRVLLEAVSRGGSRRSSSKKNDGQGAILLIGLGFLVVGYVGVFFGNIIKAAIGRQREYLADASAVKFTRNPEGISGALKKIRSGNALIERANASEFSHMYFAQGVSYWFRSLMATHPPIDDRIRRIDASWTGTSESIEPRTGTANLNLSVEPGTGIASNAGLEALGVSQLAGAAALVDSIGNLTPEHAQLARQHIESLDPALRQAAHEMCGACALAYCLVLAEEGCEITDLGDHQALLVATAFERLEVAKLYPLVKPLARHLRMPLIEMLLPALKTLTKAQYQHFEATLSALISADGKFRLFEWSLYQLITQSMVMHRSEGSLTLKQCTRAASYLLGFMAKVGNKSDEAAQKRAFEAAVTELAMPLVMPSTMPTLESTERAIAQLRKLKPTSKPRLLKALASCIQSDGVINNNEIEVLRAIAESLRCPMPLLLPQSI